MTKALCAFVFAFTVMATASASNQVGDVLSRRTVTEETRVLALSLLWAEAKFSFAYYDRIAADWDRLYQAYIPRVQGAASDYAYYLELMRFYAHLRDGHSGVFWPSEYDDALGYPPIEIRRIEGRPVVFRILRETEEISRLGLKPGLEIIEVDGRPVEELVRYWRELKTGSTEQATNRLAYFRILTGPRNSFVEILLKEPTGNSRRVRLARSERYFNDTNLEPSPAFFSTPPDRGIGYFQANQMTSSVGEAFGKYIQSSPTLAGLILDLRYNGGGSDSVSAEMISRLIDESVDGQIYEVTSYRPDRRALRLEPDMIRTRQGKILPASGVRFRGRLTILIGEQTHSAAEGGFVSVVRSRPRTVLMGEPTAGSTGQPMGFRLPGGGLGVVCSRRSFAPDGVAFVGTGFLPHVPAALTAKNLFDGRDEVLERARRMMLDSGGGG